MGYTNSLRGEAFSVDRDTSTPLAQGFFFRPLRCGWRSIRWIRRFGTVWVVGWMMPVRRKYWLSVKKTKAEIEKCPGSHTGRIFERAIEAMDEQLILRSDLVRLVQNREKK